MKNITLLIESKVSMARCNMLYEILGKFGDKLPEEIQTQLRNWASEEKSVSAMKENKVLKDLMR